MNLKAMQLTVYALLGCGLIISFVFAAGDTRFVIPVVVYSLLCGIIFFLDVIFLPKRRGTRPCPDCGRLMTRRLPSPLPSACPKCNPPVKIDVSKLPELSDSVRKICDDPSGSKLEAVKLYIAETGSSIAEAKAAVEKYLKQQKR